MLEDENGERFTELWFLTDSWTQEEVWTQGRVQIKIDISSTESFKYRVSKVFFAFKCTQVIPD